MLNFISMGARLIFFLQDPGISNQQREGTYPPYDKGLKEGIFITDSKGGKPIVGRVRSS